MQARQNLSSFQHRKKLQNWTNVNLFAFVGILSCYILWLVKEKLIIYRIPDLFRHTDVRRPSASEHTQYFLTEFPRSREWESSTTRPSQFDRLNPGWIYEFLLNESRLMQFLTNAITNSAAWCLYHQANNLVCEHKKVQNCILTLLPFTHGQLQERLYV